MRTIEVHAAAGCGAVAVTVVIISLPHVFISSATLAPGIALSLLITIKCEINKDSVL